MDSPKSPKVRDRPSREGIIKLMRGDIITLHAPATTRGYHLKTFFIDYIDNELVRLLSDQSQSSQSLEEPDSVVVLHLDEHGRFKDDDSAIKMVELIARAPEHGYARQRGFKQGTWLEIHFKDGNANGIIIGQIISLAEGSDCIGISIFNSPKDDIGRIYIDFEFKGLSHDYITEIRVCDEPEAARNAALEQSITVRSDSESDSDDSPPSSADNSDIETDQQRPDTESMSSPPPLEFDSDAQTHAIQAGDVLFLGFVTDREQMEFDVDVPEHMIRHDLDVQQNDLMESLFSDLRTDRRTLGAQKAIRREIDRFTELRTAFSIEDDHGRTQRQNYYTDDYKPLAEYLAAFPDLNHSHYGHHNQDMYDGAPPLGDWLIPIYIQRRKLYAKDADEKAELDECIISSNHANDVFIMVMGDQLQQESDEYDHYNARQSKKTFSDFVDDIKMHFTPFVRPFQEIPTAVLTARNGAFDSIITGYTNPESLQSPAYSKMRKSEFSCTVYGNMVRYIAQDELPKRAAAYITRPLPFVNLAARKQPSASVLDRAHAGYLASTDSTYLSLCMWNLGADDRALFKTRRVANASSSGQRSRAHDHALFVSSREFFIPDNDDGADEDAKLFTGATISNMVPPTSMLFNIVKTELSNYNVAMSPRILVSALDPFLIQQRHVTQVMFSEFAAFISERIVEYKDRLDQMKAANGAFANREYGVEPTGLNSLYEMVMRRHQHKQHSSQGSIFDATVIANYGLKEWTVNVNARAAAAAKRGDRTRILSNSELLSKVMTVDNGRCFMNEIVQLNHSPTYSLFGQNVDRVISQFADEAGEFVAAKETAERKSSDKCKNFVLTKEYYSLDELTTDNEMKQQQGIDILYDIKQDPTDYEFINGYRTKERSMPREVFKTFLISEVMRKKKLREHDADLEAESIINGVRRVQKGDHSVVVVRKLDVADTDVEPKESDSVAYYYYKLDGMGSWVRDHAIPETIRSDDASFFCNVQPKCIQMKEQCTSLETSAGQVNSKLLNSMAKADLISKTQQEFESQFNIGSTDFAEYMKQKESYDAYRMTKNRVLLRLEQTAQNDREFIRGLNEAAAAAAGISTDAARSDGRSILISAATGILVNIMADESFSRKQLLIVNFVNKYTRPAVETDTDKHWLVCKETGVKLLPRWMHIRATAFIGGGGGSAEYMPAAASYAEVLDQLCREYGAQEGDVWVDRITGSGAVIKSVNFSHDEGYDEDGFKQVSHSVIENAAATNAIATDRVREDYPGMADAVTMSINEQLKSPNAHKINDIVQRTLIEGLGISPDRNKLRMRIISKVIDTMATTPLFSDESKAEFMKQCRERAPPGQGPTKSDKECADMYAAYADRLIITLTLSHIVIALQCAMPSIRPSNLLQECAKYYNAPNPFGGFPLEGTKTDAMHCIKYIACVATKIKNKSNIVWASFKKSRHQIEEDIVNLIEQFISRVPRIRDELAAKRQDIIDRQNTQSSQSQGMTLPKSLSTSNWKHFFPLLHSLDGIKSVAELSPEVKSMYLKELKTCRRSQFETQEVLRGKIMQYSLYIQKCVQDIVRNEGSLLLFSGETPATENACCDETLAAGSSAIQYFMRKSELIREYNVVVSCLNNILMDIAHISRAVMFCNMDDTRTTAGATSSDFSEDTIYRGFVAFCKLDRNIPVINPAILKLAGKKPDDYTDRDEWRDKFRKLKSEHSASYTQSGFEKLLDIVNANAIVGISGGGSSSSIGSANRRQPSRIEPLRRILSSAAIQEVQVQEHVEVISDELQSDLIELLDTYSMWGSGSQQTANLESGVEVKCYNRLHEENSKMISDIRAAVIPQHQQQSSSTAAQPPKSKRSSTVATPAELIEFIEYADQFDEEAKSERASLRYASNEDAATVKYVQFIKRSIRFMMVTIPGLLTQSSFETATGAIIPRHWNFSAKHGSDIATIIGKQCASLEEFFNKEQVRRCVSQIMPLDGDAADTSLCGIIMQLVNAVPFTANNRSVLSARITRQLYKYLFVRVIKIYAYFIDNPTGKINVSVDLSASAAAAAATRAKEMTRRGTYVVAAAAAADIMDAEAKQASDAISNFLDPTQLTSVQQAHRDTIVPASIDTFQVLQDSKTQMRRLLVGLLRIVRSFKMESNKTVESVMQSTASSKRTETEQIRHKLRSMDVDKRNVVDILKKSRIGEWNVNQKQLTRYDKNTYDTGLGVVSGAAGTALGSAVATSVDADDDDDDEDAIEIAIAAGIISKNRSADDINASASESRNFDPEQYEQAIVAATQSSPEIDGQNAIAACDGDDYDNDQVMRNEFGISTTCH